MELPKEHILVCLSSAPSNAKIIRTAATMAQAFHCSFTALFVQTPGYELMPGQYPSGGEPGRHGGDGIRR